MCTGVVLFLTSSGLHINRELVMSDAGAYAILFSRDGHALTTHDSWQVGVQCFNGFLTRN